MGPKQGAGFEPRATRLPSTSLQVDREGRKPLFTSHHAAQGESRLENGKDDRLAMKNGTTRHGQPIDGLTSRGASPATANQRNSPVPVSTPGGSRIPTATARHSPSFSTRGAMSLREAMLRAEREEESDVGEAMAFDGSPSPAPRPWRAHADVRASAKKAGEELERPGSARRTLSQRQAQSDFVARSPTRPGQNEAHHELEDVDLPPLVAGIDDLPVPYPEAAGRLASPSRRPKLAPSPEKSFAWGDLDDFTAGDLQVSDSPRLKTDNRMFASRRQYDDDSSIDINSNTRVNTPGKLNTRLDEIRNLERRGGHAEFEFPSPKKYSLLDEIRAREDAAERDIPIPSRHIGATTNTKLDEIRRREGEGLSRRTLAAMRLEEIREKNAASRTSPEESRRDRDSGAQVVSESANPYGDDGEHIAGTPVTVYKGRSAGTPRFSQNNDVREWRAKTAEPQPASQGRDDSREVLQQLARTVSSPAVPTTQTASDAKTPPPSRYDHRRGERFDPSARSSARRAQRAAHARTAIDAKNVDIKTEDKKRTVGFAGLKRVQSTDDPTERLEAELKLFALADDQSAPGSVRGASPFPKEEDAGTEATPKARRQDPLLMPTPRVTGAYVETPATVRVDHGGEPSTVISPVKLTLSDHRRSSSWGSNERDLTQGRVTAERAPENEEEDRVATATGASTTTVAERAGPALRKRRSRSLPRQRSPIRNSVRVPSVIDDLRELHQKHNVEDSTLDEFEEIMNGEMEPPLAGTADAVLQQYSGADQDETVTETAPEPRSPGKRESASPAKPPRSHNKEESPEDEEERAQFGRLSRLTQSISRSLSTSKKGIEQLEHHVTSRGGFAAPKLEKPEKIKEEEDPAAPQPPRATTSTVTYLAIPVPRLYHREPRFRLTSLGLVVLVLSLWYAAESAMYARFARPTSCDPSVKPCVWSYDDPTAFGTAIPIKLDQWATGGAGRQRLGALREAADDWRMDVVDAARGRKITDVKMELLGPEARRQHSRRLRKRGLIRKRAAPSAEDRQRWEAWRRERRMKERAQAAREMGYEYAWGEEGGEETIGGDSRVY